MICKIVRIWFLSSWITKCCITAITIQEFRNILKVVKLLILMTKVQKEMRKKKFLKFLI
jgi:hypothetical protein